MKFATPLPLENQFSTAITYKEAADGISIAIQNSKELLEDAEILMNNKRYPRAISLSVLAIEEYGKVEKIKELLLSKQMASKIWKDLRNHKSKNFYWMFPLLKQMGVNDPELIAEFTSPKGDGANFLDQLKQICFYTEAVNNPDKKGCYWWLPSEITNLDVAKFYCQLAKTIVHDDGILWTEEALKVYAEHATYEDGKSYYKDMISYYKALLDGKHITEDRFRKIYSNIAGQKQSDMGSVDGTTGTF